MCSTVESCRGPGDEAGILIDFNFSGVANVGSGLPRVPISPALRNRRLWKRYWNINITEKVVEGDEKERRKMKRTNG